MAIEILNGNELIIRGALEAGVDLFTGYPGSPLADYFNILHHQKNNLQKMGIRVAIANSEANAAAMASGAKQANRNTIVAMKSMGLHVASDALSVGNFANPGIGGVVVVVGDDPWSMSTSTPADSRYLFKHLHMPFLSPSTPQELKDWIKIAMKLSQESSVYVGYLLTTAMAEGGGRVEVASQIDGITKIEKTLFDPATFDLSQNVMVPPNSLKADISMIKNRFPRVVELIKKLGLDEVYGNRDARVGLLASGVCFEMTKAVLDESQSLDVVSLYKTAFEFPLVSEELKSYLSSLETLIVVEEKRGFLEGEVRELAHQMGLKLQIIGKEFEQSELFPAHGGLNHDLIFDKLKYVFTKLNLKPLCQGSHTPVVSLGVLPRRLPTFCPGCPHRETLSVLKDLRGWLKKQNINLISHGDVGCYSLSFLEPFKEMHNLSAMGQGGALGAGFDLFSANPSIVLMGDSTFFHSGITDISNSVQLGHDITYILLDNDNTAMTGHQMTPRTGESVEGMSRPKQDIKQAVSALGVTSVTEVNPSDRYFYQNLMRDLIQQKGTKVIISNKECGLTFHGRQKKDDRKLFQNGETRSEQIFYQINTDACEDCRVCVESTGCPGLTQVFDAYGSKVAIDPQICVSDSYCTKLKACPSFEKIIVKDYHPSKYQASQNGNEWSQLISKLSTPISKIQLEDIAKGRDFRVVVTGVGGSGITTISRVLAEAALKMRSDIDFKFFDQKGLAQRNGNVTGHLSFFAKGKSHAPTNHQKSCDLLLSTDLLDGSQHVGFLSDQGHLVLDGQFQVPLSILLDREDQSEAITADVLGHEVKKTFQDRAHLISFKKASEKHLGRSIYSTSMLLGFIFQKGFLPFSENDLKDALSRSVPKVEYATNELAFHMGRLLAENPESLFAQDVKEDEIALFEQSIRSAFLFGAGEKIKLFHSYLTQLQHLQLRVNKEYLGRYLHDIIVFDGGKGLGEFLQGLKKIKELYDQDEKLQQMAVRVLAKTFWVKDEVFVSHLMLSPMLALHDQKKYSKLGTSFYKHRMNRPKLGNLEMDFSPKDWMLKMARHGRFLRTFFPTWHAQDREINLRHRQLLLGQKCDYQALKSLENVKGYREVKYEKVRISL